MRYLESEKLLFQYQNGHGLQILNVFLFWGVPAFLWIKKVALKVL
jgi:hypothetical protein